jgi:putative endonuclease
MTNRPNGTLYVGVTGNLQRRVWEHREGVADGFTMQYGLKRLVMPNGIKISGLQYTARVT